MGLSSRSWVPKKRSMVMAAVSNVAIAACRSCAVREAAMWRHMEVIFSMLSGVASWPTAAAWAASVRAVQVAMLVGGSVDARAWSLRQGPSSAARPDVHHLKVSEGA